MNYEISYDKPPVYEQADKLWNVSKLAGLIMVYGPVIHMLGPKAHLGDGNLTHELIHVKQQGMYNGGPEAWWSKYLDNPQFRLSQELEAYRTQWRYLPASVGDRNRRHVLLAHWAKSLAGGMYGKIISYNEALKLIQAK